MKVALRIRSLFQKLVHYCVIKAFTAINLLSLFHNSIVMEDEKVKFLLSSANSSADLQKFLLHGDKFKALRLLNTILSIWKSLEIPLEIFLLKKKEGNVMNFLIGTEVIK